MSDFEPNEALYENGIAVGHSDVKNDTIFYRFRNETFEFPTSKVYHLRFMNHGFNGYFYTAPVEELRKLAAAGQCMPQRELPEER